MDLTERVRDWKKSLRKHAGLEDGFIEELETHLYDQIEVFIDQGKSPNEAFDLAVKSLGDIRSIEKDEKIRSPVCRE